MSACDAGILTLGSAAERLDREHDRSLLLIEADLAGVLERGSFSVVSAGAPYPEEERVATDSRTMRRHVRTLLDFRPCTVLLNLCGRVPAAGVVEAVRHAETRLPPPLRLIVFADSSRVEATAVLAAAAALRRRRYAVTPLYGPLSAAATQEALAAAVRFARRRHDEHEQATRTLARLSRTKILVAGSTLGRIEASATDPEAMSRALSVGLEKLDARLADERAALIRGPAGRVPPDARLRAALASAAPGADQAGELAARLATYYALADLAHERAAGGVAMGEGADPAVAAWLCDVTGPDGRPKDALPAATDDDIDGVLTQLLLATHTGGPAWPAELVELAPALRLRAPATPAGPVTLARLARDGDGYELAALEGTCAGGGHIQASVSPDRLLAAWPGGRAALAAGHHAAALVEIAGLTGGAVSIAPDFGGPALTPSP